jgi:hypothetical protein
MKSIFGRGSMIAGLSLVCILSAKGQTQDAAAARSLALPTPVHTMPASSVYQYGFIAKAYVWSNKPLKKTAGKICQTMRDRSFNETPYAVNGDQDWNACLDTQIRSIGYLRWLRNNGFRPTSKNRKNAQAYLQKTYTMGPWGSYTFPQLTEAVKATTQQHP